MTLSQFGMEFMNLTLVHLLALMSPGPDFAISVRQSLRFGRRTGMVTALGISTGLSIHVLYTLLGAGALLRSTPWLMRGTAVVGACYLMYVGIGFLRSQEALPEDISKGEDPSPTRPAMPSAGNPAAGVTAGGTPYPAQPLRRAFWTGFITNATNPKVPFFFFAVFASLISPGTPLWVQGIYGVWMCVLTALWFMLVSLIFTHHAVRAPFLKIHRTVERLMGAVLQIFALRLLWQVWTDAI